MYGEVDNPWIVRLGGLVQGAAQLLEIDSESQLSIWAAAMLGG
jgi:hypothetical protein